MSSPFASTPRSCRPVARRVLFDKSGTIGEKKKKSEKIGKKKLTAANNRNGPRRAPGRAARSRCWRRWRDAPRRPPPPRRRRRYHDAAVRHALRGGGCGRGAHAQGGLRDVLPAAGGHNRARGARRQGREPAAHRRRVHQPGRQGRRRRPQVPVGGGAGRARARRRSDRACAAG